MDVKTAEKTAQKQRTFTANLFIDRLQKRVNKRIFIQIGLGILLFFFGFLFVTDVTNEINADRNLRMLKETFLELYENNRGYLDSEDTVQAAAGALTTREIYDFERSFNRFNLKNPVNNEVILTDADYHLRYASF